MGKRVAWRAELTGERSNQTRYDIIAPVTLPHVSMQFEQCDGLPAFQFPGPTVKFEAST